MFSLKVEKFEWYVVAQPFLSTHASAANFKLSDGKLNLLKMSGNSQILM